MNIEDIRDMLIGVRVGKGVLTKNFAGYGGDFFGMGM